MTGLPLEDRGTLRREWRKWEQAMAQLKAQLAASRASEERMALALEASGTGVWDRDVRTGIIEYSPGWKAILGYGVLDITHFIEDSYKRVHPDDLAYVQATIQDHFDGKTGGYEVEHRLRCKDGSYKWVSSRGKVVARDADGKPLRMIGTTTDISDRKHTEAELRQFATVDHLTDLFNRRQFLLEMETELARIQQKDAAPAAILMFDLDHFKAINDRWGHAVGDEALKHFSTVLRRLLRKSDVGGRLGGEEFALLLPDTGLSQACAVARRVQERIATEPLMHDQRSIGLKLSVGVTLMRGADENAGASLARSDEALYMAKKNGRNRIEIRE